MKGSLESPGNQIFKSKLKNEKLGPTNQPILLS